MKKKTALEHFNDIRELDVADGPGITVEDILPYKCEVVGDSLKALEIIKENFIIKFDKEKDMKGNVWGLLVSIQAKENEGEWDCTATANLAGYEEEFNLLKEVLE